MRIPELTQIGLEIIDIIQRADATYVPSAVFEKYIKKSSGSIRTVLYRMTKAGLLRAKMGPAGGYRTGRTFSLKDLLLILSPSSVSAAEAETCNERVNTSLRKINEVMELCYIVRK